MSVQEALVEFLASNEGDREKELKMAGDSWRYDDFHAWSGGQLDAVVDAAKHNTSVRTLSIDAADFELEGGIGSAENVSSFVRHLRSLQSVDIHDSDHSDDPAPARAVDTVLHGIIKGEANVTSLRLLALVSPGVFLKFAERFPHLESLALQGPCIRSSASSSSSSSNDLCHQCSSHYEDYATEVAIAANRVFTSLHRLSLEYRGALTTFTDLLSDVGGAASACLKELHIVVSTGPGTDDAQCLLEAVARLCSLTRTIGTLKITCQDEELDLLDVTPMFQFWARHPISDSVREMHLDRCTLAIGSNAVEGALRKFETLHFTDSVVPPAILLVKDLPHLRSFHFNYLDAQDSWWGSQCRRSFLKNNSKLEMLCEHIERRGSPLDDVEIDLVGGHDPNTVDADGDDDSDDNDDYPFERYAASERLLRACKGRLGVNFASLPMCSSYDIVGGLTSLRPDLKELRLHFAECQFSDAHYGRILKAVQQNKTLAVFEFGLDFSTTITDDIISNVGDLVATNDTLETISLVGFRLDAAARLLDCVLPILETTPNMTLRGLQLQGFIPTGLWPHIQKSVLSMLDKNPVLSQLDGLEIPWNDPAASQVRKLLKLNRYGRRFLPPHDDNRPPVATGLWATILARIAKDDANEVMYTFLRAKLVSILHDSHYDPPSSSAVLDPPPSRRSGRRKRGRSEEE